MSSVPPTPPQRLVPVWLDRLASVAWRLLVTAAMALVIAAVAVMLVTVTASVLLSVLVAVVMTPTVQGLRARGLSRSIAAAIAVGTASLTLVLVTVLLVIAIAPSLREIVQAAVAGIRDIAAQLASLGAPGWAIDALSSLADSVRELVSINPAALGETAITLGTVLVLAFFLVFFLLQDGDRGWDWAMNLLSEWQAATVTESASLGLIRVSRYVRRTAVLAAVDAIAMGIVLTLLGVPHVAALTAMVFLAGFVPYLGAIAMTVTLVLVSLALVSTPAAVIVLVAAAATSIVAARLLAGTSLGAEVDVSPIIVALAIPTSAALFGVLGLVAGLPVIVFLLAVMKSIVVALGLGPAADRATTDAWGVPPWLDRLAQWSWRGLVVVGVGWVTVQIIVLLPVIVVPVVLAIVIAATVLPVVEWLVRAGWSRSAAAATTTLGGAVLVVFAFAASIAWTLRPLREIADEAIRGAADLDISWLEDAVAEVVSTMTIDVGGWLATLLLFALGTIMFLLLTFFFLRDGSAAWHGFTGRVDGARRERLDRAGERAVSVLSGYMAGTAAISLFGGVTSWLIMAILGLPLAVPIGVLSFFGGFIPYIGSFVATALAFLVAVAAGTTTDIVIMAGYTVVFNLIQGSGVAPIVYGKALSLHPAVVLLAVPIGGAVAGILGMFLVVPIAAIISATWRLVIEMIEIDASSSDDKGDPGDHVATRSASSVAQPSDA